MTVHEVGELIQSQEGVRHATLTMALGIIMDRVKCLPQDDKDDLYELAKGLPNAKCGEEIDSIFAAMMEILDQKPIRVRRMEDPNPPSNGLQRWMDYVSERIRDAREAAKMTQADLAERTGLPQSHISRLETGKHSPSRVTLEKIAKALDVPLTAFDPSE